MGPPIIPPITGYQHAILRATASEDSFVIVGKEICRVIVNGNSAAEICVHPFPERRR